MSENYCGCRTDVQQAATFVTEARARHNNIDFDFRINEYQDHVV